MSSYSSPLLAVYVQEPSVETVPLFELELWLFEAQPIGIQRGAGLQQLQLDPIGRLSPDTSFPDGTLLRT